MSTFSLEFKETKSLKGIVETLSSIIDETVITITPKEIRFEAMDPSRICLLKLTINKEDFEKFVCTDTYKIGINLDDLNKILKRSSVSDSLVLTYEEDAQRIKLTMRKKKAKRKRTFSLALIDLDQEEIPFTNVLAIEYNARFIINPTIIAEAIKDAEIYSEILSVKTDPEKGLLFNSLGQIGEMTYELGLEELGEHKIDEIAVGAYSIVFLKGILKLSTITKELDVSVRTDYPIKMIFTL